MTKKLLLSLIIFFSITINSIAELPEILINPDNEEYTRISSGLAGSNITIINSDEIKKNLDRNIPEILESYSGITVRNLYDGVDGKNSSLDMRGFGEASKSNVLILINGLRLNDIDMSNVSFSHIPIESIKRIEIIRGGSAATLYGSGAVGGTINIVTDNEKVTNNIRTSFGTNKKQKLDFTISSSINQNSSLTLSGSGLANENFRESADYSNGSFILNFKNSFYKTKFNLDYYTSNQEQDLPGPRVKGGAVYNYHFCNRYEDSRTAKHIGGSTAKNGNDCNLNQRDDYSDSKNERVNASFMHEIDDTNKFSINLGYKNKTDKAFLAANGNTKQTPDNGDRFLNTKIDGNFFNSRYENKLVEERTSNILNIGFDHAHSFYESNRHRKEDEPLGHAYHADLKIKAFYLQNTIYFNDLDMALSTGFRSEKTYFTALDDVDRTVTGFINSWEATDHSTYNNTTSNHAMNIGIEKKLNKNISVYSNYSESFRIPNIDERIKATTSGSFALKDQESEAVELGFIYKNTTLSLNTSYYKMDTINEIQYDQSVNTNLDPIERQGVNIDLNYIVDQKQKISASLNITDAEFTSGTLSMGTGTTEFLGVVYYSGNETYGYGTNTAINYLDSDGTANQSISLSGHKVPLVSPITFSVDYDLQIENNTIFNLGIKYNDEKYVSNDQENIEPKIPDYYLMNTSLTSINGPYTVSVGVNNVLDKKAYDFAVSSTFHDDAHYGLSSVYPLAERNMFVNFGYTF